MTKRIVKCRFAQRTAALEKYDIAVQEMQHDEKMAEKKAEEEEVAQKEHDLHEVRP